MYVEHCVLQTFSAYGLPSKSKSELMDRVKGSITDLTDCLKFFYSLRDSHGHHHEHSTIITALSYAKDSRCCASLITQPQIYRRKKLGKLRLSLPYFTWRFKVVDEGVHVAIFFIPVELII